MRAKIYNHPYLGSLFIVAISLTFNWIIQVSYYYYSLAVNPYIFRGLRTPFDYKTGFIGDAILIPILNVCIYIYLIKSKARITRSSILIAGSFGLLGDFAVHFLQGKLGLINWAMPAPYHWTGATYWHMISLFFQLSYIFLFLVILWQKRKRVTFSELLPAGLTFLVVGVFVVLFIEDYKPTTSFLAILLHFFS